MHGNHCFFTKNYVEDVNVDAPGGESAGIYTKCKYSKVLGNTVVNSSMSNVGQPFNGAITIKGKERYETDGAQGCGAMVANNHIIFTDSTSNRRIGIKIHAGWINISNNIFEGATLAWDEALPLLPKPTIDENEGSEWSIQP